MKEYPTSNDNYKIQQPETQLQFLTRDEEIVPKTNLDNIITYAPIRNIHTYSVMKHGEKY